MNRHYNSVHPKSNQLHASAAMGSRLSVWAYVAKRLFASANPDFHAIYSGYSTDMSRALFFLFLFFSFSLPFTFLAK